MTVPSLANVSSSAAKPQRATASLVFAAVTVTLGTWFVGGFFNIALNVPQAHIVTWIRWVECGRHDPVRDNHTASYELWCGELTAEEEALVLRDNLKLNNIWSILNAVVNVGVLVSTLSCTYLIRRFGVKGTLYVGSAFFMVGTLLSALDQRAVDV